MKKLILNGVLGADFFNCCLVEIDYDRRALVFYRDTDANRQKFEQVEWRNLEMRVNGNTPFLHTNIRDGQGEKAVKLLLDTGSTGTLSLFSGGGHFVVPEQTFEAKSAGISGDSTNRVGRLKGFTMGSYEIAALPVYFRTSGSNPESGSHGILGNAVMQRFNQVFDFQGENFWVKKNQHYSKPVLVDRSGLRLWPHEQGAIVKSVAPGTGADSLNLSPGTIITHIEDERLVSGNFDRLTQLLESRGREVVSVCWRIEAKQQCGNLKLEDRLPVS